MWRVVQSMLSWWEKQYIRASPGFRPFCCGKIWYNLIVSVCDISLSFIYDIFNIITHLCVCLSGYHCEYKKRTGKKPDGCAVVFKTSRFSLLSSNPVEFFRPGDTLLDRDNVGLVVLLRPNKSFSHLNSSSFICVANTHLLYNPRRGDIKLAQLAILLAEINRLSRLPNGQVNPVVLCGDFNSAPWSPLYSFLTTGFLQYSGMQIGMVRILCHSQTDQLTYN